MRLLVNAAVADKRGAFSLVKGFIREMHSNNDYLKVRDIKIEFLVARPELKEYETDSIKINFVSKPKSGLIARWMYENNELPEYTIRSGFDCYLSLQNYILKDIGIKQFALIHQPIPFSDLRFNELEFKHFIRQKMLLSHYLRKQRKLISGVIVQTEWMKHALETKFNYRCPFAIVKSPVSDLKNNNEELGKFLNDRILVEGFKVFYPTNTEKYKNNDRLIQAIEEYNKHNEIKITLFITIEGESSKYIVRTGKIPYESIYTMYSNMNALIFPSLTETMGFPLLEALQCNLPIIASDLPYAREICKDGAFYFDPRSQNSIINSLIEFTNEPLKHLKSQSVNSSENSYLRYIEFISGCLL